MANPENGDATSSATEHASVVLVGRPVLAHVAIGVWILLSVVGWIAIVGAFALIVTW